MAFPLSKLVGLISLFGVIIAVPVADMVSRVEKRDVADADDAVDVAGVDIVDKGSQTLGFRCPYPPNEDGRWPDACYDVIGSKCQCLYDDMVFTQRQCLLGGREKYEAMLLQQMALERERNIRRRDEGLPVQNEPYEYLWNCYSQINNFIGYVVLADTTGSD